MSNMKFEFTIRIEGLDAIAEAIGRLATAMGAPEKAQETSAQIGTGSVQNQAPAAPVNPAGTFPVAGQAATPVAGAAVQGQMPVTLPAQMQGQIPVTPPAPPAPQNQPQPGGTMIPTTAVPAAYTCDQLAVAASQLVNAGKQMRLHEILHGFGVNSLMEMAQEQYGAFAAALKAEGVKI